MKILLLDIAWLAGLLEGEGSFVWHKTVRDTGRPRIQVQMTDEDVLIKVATIMDASLTGPYYSKQKTISGEEKKPTWYVHCSGEKAYLVMKQILPYMGIRRAKQIAELMLKYKENNH